MSFVGAVGEANCDLLYSGMPRVPDEGEEIYSKGFEMQLGGGSPATIINLASLNVPVRLGTFLGQDFFSKFVEAKLIESKMEFRNFYRGTGQPVAISTAIITENDRAFVSYKDPLEITSESYDQIYDYLKGAAVIGMGTVCKPVWRRLKDDGAVIVFDTGWEADLSFEKYKEQIEIADYYTPNQKEALKITGANDPYDAIKELSKHFRKAIVKLDKDGCLIRENGRTSLIPPMKGINAVDATGAGDAFLSGFMYGLFYDFDFSDCIRLGNITGGTCVQAVGCLTSRINQQDMLSKLKAMQ